VTGFNVGGGGIAIVDHSAMTSAALATTALQLDAATAKAAALKRNPLETAAMPSSSQLDNRRTGAVPCSVASR
jgi:hypothetical protein